MNAPEQAIKIYRGDDTDWNGETLLNFTVTADFDMSDFTAEFLLGGITKKNISLADGGNFEVNFSHEETAQMPWGLNKGILKIFDADKRIKTVTNDILFWVTNEPVGEQTESIVVPVPESSPVQITLQIGGGSSGGGAWGSITGNIQNQTDLQEEFAEVQGQIDAIDGLIPAQASTDNKLADKNFVNSSISTNTAYFIGTFESVEALEAYSGTVTNNDYAFVVGTDSDGNTVYNRYKYTTATTPSSWLFEYALNNSSFTAAQWAAIQSGITSSLVTQIGTNTNNISAKQPKTLETPLTVDGTQQTTVEGALGAVNTLAGKGLANKATGTSSLTILGTATTTSNSINIGTNSKAVSYSGQVAIGNSAWSQGLSATSLGSQANALDNNTIAIGAYCTASKPSSIAIGGDSTPAMATKNSAIQLGAGTNNTANSFQVFGYQLLDGSTGKIPAARLPSVAPELDNKSVNLNSSDELQAIGVIDQNNTSNAIKTWTGTKDEYDDIVSKDAHTFYNVTDDLEQINLPIDNIVSASGVSNAKLTINASTDPLKTADNWKYETSFLWTTATPYSDKNYILFSCNASSSADRSNCPLVFFKGNTFSVGGKLTDGTSIGGENIFQPFTNWDDRTFADLQLVFDGTEYYANIKKASESAWTKYTITTTSLKLKFGYNIIMLNFADGTQPCLTPMWLSKTKISYNNGTVLFDGKTAFPSLDYTLTNIYQATYLGGLN